MFDYQLKSIKDDLETYTSVAFPVNDSIEGWWLKIAKAAEGLAGVITPSNANIEGYLYRAVKALESLSGSDGLQENDNADGLLKRFVDALEIRCGLVTAGTIEERAVRSARKLRIDAAAALFPANSVAPAISGTLQEASTLTTTNGTWTNAPTFTRQWYENDTNDTVTPTAIAGQTATTLVLTNALVGRYIFCRVTATNASGAVVADSNVVGPIAILSGLSSTSLTKTSAPGAVLSWTVAAGADIQNGYILNIESSVAGAKDGAGRYTTPVMVMEHYFTVSELAVAQANSGVVSLDMTELAADGYIEPSGTGFMQAWWSREDGVVGPKTEITYSVSASVATWAQSSGDDRNASVDSTTPFLFAAMNGHAGAACGVRALPAATGQKHFEVTIDGLRATQGIVTIGVTDYQARLGPAVYGITPGYSGTTTKRDGSTGWPQNGACVRLYVGNASADIFRNAAQGSSVALGAAPAAGDVVIVEFDTSANTVSMWYYRLATTTTTNLMSGVTLSSNIPAAWHGFASGNSFNTNADRDKWTANFGASAFIRTPTSGYTGW